MSNAELIVFDHEEPCPYLAGRSARMPLRVPRGELSPQSFDRKLAEGDRRAGEYLYRTKCPGCRACEPIRLRVSQFRPNRTQRLQWNRGNRRLDVQVIQPIVDDQRVALFNKHRLQRGLADETREISHFGYENFLVETCCNTLEIDYSHDGELKAVAICDRGQQAVSAVYCFFDPEYREVSLGVYSVLMHVELCRRWNVEYLYLGYYIAESPHMRYKSGYRPHQRLIDGQWRQFD